MMRPVLLFSCLLIISFLGHTQDTTLVIDDQKITLGEVVVRNNFDYRKVLKIIQEDTTFYKAFKNLRIIGYTSFNNIQMLDKKGKVQASLNSKTRQTRADGCRTMEVLQEQVTGDFYDRKGGYNYNTAELYASLFFTKGKECGEDNIIKGRRLTTEGKKGIEKQKEQLKMLFFLPGKKIPGIPFIGNKLDLYDASARKVYDYRLDVQEYKGKPVYVFSIQPKDKLGLFRKDDVVIDEMVTWFDIKTLEVLARNYSLSYKAGVYDFDVAMEVEMTRVGNLVVPSVLRYKGNWDVVFKKRERSIFTATIFDYKL